MADVPLAHPLRVIGRLARRTLAAMNGLSSRAKRRKMEARLVANSGLFDCEWYLNSYPDVAEAGADPLGHYMTCGWREGRDPGPEFATSSYLRANSDVARSGINPLLHYIEFGHGEGRGTFGHRMLIQGRASPSFDFASAAPCRSFPLSEESVTPWVRAYRLDSRRPDLRAIGEVPIGYCGEAAAGRDIENARRLLALLSGVETAGPNNAAGKLPKSEFDLIDCWYLNSAQLRTRWAGKARQFVVRALQHDASCNEAICLVGEGRVSSPLDVVDFQLKDAFYPLLFIFCEPDGSVLACRVLAFPSLCRGGVHYPELIGSMELGPHHGINVVSHSDVFAERLLMFLNGDADPVVQRIICDLHDADGATLLFQPRIRRWLQKIFRIRVDASSSFDETATDRCLKTTAQLPPGDVPREGAALVLKHDMVPTIAALTEPRSVNSRKGSEAIMPLLVAGREPTMPVSLIEVPPQTGALLEEIGVNGVGGWPRLVVGQGSLPITFPPAAIRVRRGDRLSDAELLVPMADLPIESTPRPAITWLIEASGSHERELYLGIQSLMMQSGGDHDALAIVGSPDRATLSMAQQRFAGGVADFSHVEAAIASIDTPLTGFMGHGIILHDPRAAGVLSRLLDHGSVATASCVLIRGEKAGRTWHAAAAEVGVTEKIDSRLKNCTDQVLVEHLWASTYPVAAPPRDLWLTRSSNVRGWIEESWSGETVDGFHLCSFMVTASHVGYEGDLGPGIVVPPAPTENALRVRAYIG
jgi:hypothetical protein